MALKIQGVVVIDDSQNGTLTGNLTLSNTSGTIRVGNSTVNSTANATTLLLSGNGTSVPLVNVYTGNTTVNTFTSANGAAFTIVTANSTATPNTTYNVSSLVFNANAGTNSLINSTALYLQSNTGTPTIFVGNSTVNSIINATSIKVTSVFANSSNGTTGQVLTSNSTGGIYWATPSGGGATLVANNTDTQTFYIPMSNTSTGSWTNGVVSTTQLYFVPSTGILYSTNFNTLSDKSKKENIETITDALSKVSSLRGVTYTWIQSKLPSLGVIAQEVEEVLPELISTNDKGEKTVSYGNIVGLLIEAIKEQNAIIKQLEGRVIDLESK